MKADFKRYSALLGLMTLVAALFLYFHQSHFDELKSYYPNGKIKAIVTTTDGLQNGVATEYFESGELKVEAYY